MTHPLVRAAILVLTAGLTLAPFGSGVVSAEKQTDPVFDVPDGALTLHLREIDLVHAFFVLNDLTSQSYIVDPGVKGKVSVDLEQATLEEALAAMRSAGAVVGPGALHRVSRAGSSPAAATPSQESYTGERISVSLENVELTNIICALGTIPNLQRVHVGHNLEGVMDRNPQYKVLVPPDLQGRTSIFSSDLPWDQVLDGLLSPLGLISVLDEDGLLVGSGSEASVRSQAGAVDACEISSKPAPTSPLSVNLSNLDAADLELVGLAQKGDAWKAYAYAPGRQLLSLETGQKLRDASVKEVGRTGVAFLTDAEEVVNVSLRP